MLRIEQVTTDAQKAEALALFREYLEWVDTELKRHYGIHVNMPAAIAQEESKLHRFEPPEGRLLLAYVHGEPVGVLAMKLHSDGAAELKRMYVRPSSRGQGGGRALVERALREARQAERPLIRLDTAGYMHAAHALYRSLGFRDAEPYPESEVPREFWPHWVFMELPLHADE